MCRRARCRGCEVSATTAPKRSRKTRRLEDWPPMLKLKRGAEHLRELSVEIERFEGEEPASVIAEFRPDRPGHDFRYEIDPSRAEAALGWKAPHDFETGIARTIDWYLANQPWWEGVRAAREIADHAVWLAVTMHCSRMLGSTS